MPDLEHSHRAHRETLQQIWRSKEWKEARAVFKTFHKDNKCERCGVIGVIVPGHCDADYQDMSTYISKVRENKVEALCPKCNGKQKKGYKPCPSCIRKYQETKGERWIRYIPQFMEVCSDCSDPGDREIREKGRAAFQVFVKRRRGEQNERDRIARRPYQDAQNLKRRIFYRKVVKRKV